MMLIPALHVVLLAVSVVTTGILTAYAWRHRTELGVASFGGLMAGFTVYSGAHLIGLLVLDPVWRLVWENLQWTGTAIIPIFWLLFGLEYTGNDEMITRRTVGVVSIIPLLTIVLIWTNPWHGLMWTENTVVVVDGLAVLEQPFGPWAVAYTGIGYGMIAVGGFLILRLVWLSDQLYTSQALLLIVGIVVPVGANVLTVIGLTPIRDPPLDMSPYAFSITGLAFGYALFRHRLFDLIPAAQQLGRNAAIRDLEDGVIIVGTDRRIIYCNRAAADLLDSESADILGEPVRSLVDESKLDFDVEDSLAELERDDGVYEVRTSPIRDRHDQPIGHTLIVQDITARKRRERQLVRQRDELARLDRLNAVVRGVNQALVSATSREEIERAVCDHLAEPEVYRIACVADIPTWSGDADRWTVATADGDPVVTDKIPGEGIGLEDVGSEPSTEIPVDRHDVWTVVPLVHGRTVYGALGLQSGNGSDADETAVSDREREVLAELGELIGQVMSAVENRQLLAAESVVELEIHSTDDGGALVDAASRTDAQLKVTGLVPDAGEGHLAYVRVTNGSPEMVADVLAADEDAAARVIRDGGEREDEAPAGLVEWTVPPGTPLGTLAERGAKVLEVTVENETARFVAEVASDADVRALVERVQRDVPDTWLESIQECNRPVERADSVPNETVEDLTDRQQEALEAAYRAGYYGWPRDSTAEEVADTLDIAAPTLHAHLRKAENSLLAELFDRERRSPD